jgi:6-phosphogluconolactonase
MSTQVVRGQLIVSEEAAQVAEQAATHLGRALQKAASVRGYATLALSGGNTPRAAYARLAHDPGVDWGKVRVFWVDERAVPPTDDRSNYRWAKATLLDAARVPAEHVYRMQAERPDADAAARDYERVLLRGSTDFDANGVPCLDAVVLGVGDDGHTASLFPGEPTVEIMDRLVVAVAAKPGREARMTLTAPVLQSSQHVFVLAVGHTKNQPLLRVWDIQGNVRDTPARIVRDCRGAVTWLVDRAAAGLTAGG